MVSGAMPGVETEPRRFFYHRAVAPMLWALLGISLVEIAVAHLLLAVLWSGMAALVLSVATAIALGWLVRLLLTMPKRPVLLWRDRVVLQVGTLRRVEIPLSAVASAGAVVDPGLRKDRSVLNMALLSQPNVVVRLKSPMMVGRRGVDGIAHRLDDPDAFVAACKALGTPA